MDETDWQLLYFMSKLINTSGLNVTTNQLYKTVTGQKKIYSTVPRCMYNITMMNSFERQFLWDEKNT